MNLLTENEYLIISKIFEGSLPGFNTIMKQLDFLTVASRTRLNCYYRVELQAANNEISLLDCDLANVKIEDVRLTIDKAKGTFFVTATLLKGCLSCLEIDGDYDFNNDFKISKVFWSLPIEGSLTEVKFIYESNERDYETAIGYIPTYM